MILEARIRRTIKIIRMTQKHHSKRYHHQNKKNLTKQLSNKLAKLLRPWHRRLGIFSALFIILMASTGVLINHSNHLSIDTASVQQKWMLDYYGISPPNQIIVYQTAPLSLASSDNLAWVQHQLAVEADSPIKGMISVGQMILAVDKNHLYMLSKNGELMEKQDASMGLPRDIEAIGFDGQVWLKTSNGYFMADDELIEWRQAMPFAPIPWSQAIESPASQLESDNISLLARSSHLNWERVILDIHSGRFFGALGPWFMDLVALALMIMAISGIYLWQQGRPKR